MNPQPQTAFMFVSVMCWVLAGIAGIWGFPSERVYKLYLGAISSGILAIGFILMDSL